MNKKLTLLILTYIVLACLYCFSIPLLEAPDEYYHFAVIEYISSQHKTPPRTNIETQPWRQIVFHAPLYHYLGAALILPIETSDFYSAYPHNPHAQIGVPHAAENQNFVAHVGDRWQQTGLAICLIRLFSISLGGITLCGIFALVRQILPHRPQIALLASLLVMLNPQFLFISSVVNNDNLVTALSTLSLAVLIGMIRTKATGYKVTFLALLLALNALAKASGMILYPIVILGMIGIGWRDRWSFGQWIRFAFIVMVMWIIIAGWWYWDNWVEYGDPTATQQVAEATGARIGKINYQSELRGLYFSFWGLFGWFNIIPSPNYYQWTGVVVILGSMGLLKTTQLKQRQDDIFIFGLLAFFLIAFIGSWLHFNTLVLAGQGRLWFPLLGIIGGGLAWGLTQWQSKIVILIPIIGMAAATVAFPSFLIAPTYTPISQISTTNWQPPIEATSVKLREPWTDRACLTVWINPAKWNNSVAELEVAFEAHCEITGYWSYFVHLIDPKRETCAAGNTSHILAQYDSMPNGGKLPFPALSPNHVIQERVTIHALYSPDWQLQLGLYDAQGTFIRMFVEDLDRVGKVASVPNNVFIGKCGTVTIAFERE